MTQIGQFAATPGGFAGHIRTLTLDAQLHIVAADSGEVENAPD